MEDSRTNARLIGNCREYRRQTPINKSNSNSSTCSYCSIKRCSIKNVNYITENLKDKNYPSLLPILKNWMDHKNKLCAPKEHKNKCIKGVMKNSASTHLFRITWRYYEQNISRALFDVGSYKSLMCINKMVKIGGKPPRERLLGIIQLNISPLRII